MYSDSVRREAMLESWHARDIALTGKVRLLQEVEQDPQVGFLMYLAYFAETDSGASASKPEGWVYAPFRMNDLMQAIFPQPYRDIAFAIYDQTAQPQNLMYRTENWRDGAAGLHTTRRVEVGLREWTIRVTSAGSGSSVSDYPMSLIILFTGLLASVSLFALTVGFVASRTQARVNATLLIDKQISEKRISVILNSTTTALLAIDTEGNILEANRQASELFGYSRQTLVSMKIEALLPLELRERHQLYRRQYNADPHKRAMGQRQDLYAQNVRGKMIPVEIGLSPLKTDGALQILATIVDIRERLKEKKEKERILEQLSAKNVEMEQFVYTVSHDLKSPLVTINGFTKLLRDSLQDQLDDKQAHWLTRIAANVASMEGLLNDLLELSRIIHRTLELEEVPLDEVLREVTNSLSQQIRDSSARISLDLQAPQIVAHKRLVVQCLQNLLSNAMQYRKPNEACEVHVSSRNDGQWTRIVVADNGIGIAKAHQQRIFEIFERLSAKGAAGSGVGLAVVKTAMEKHGGYVSVVSELGEGSEFTLHFPKG